MLDNLMNSIGGDVISSITEKAGISAEQAQQILPIAQEGVQSGLMEQVTGGNVSGLMGMLQGGGSGGFGGSIFDGIKSNIMSGIMQKVGLPESVANIAAGAGLQSIMGGIAGQASEAGETNDIDQDSIMSVLGMGGAGGGIGDMVKGKLGDMAKDKLGNLFG